MDQRFQEAFERYLNNKHFTGVNKPPFKSGWQACLAAQQEPGPCGKPGHTMAMWVDGRTPSFGSPLPAVEHIKEFEAENARLREALQAIGEMPDGYCICSIRDPLKPEDQHTGECRDARRALTQSSTGPATRESS